MKILLPLDGSECSELALDEVFKHTWPDGSEIKVLSVAHGIPQIPDPTMVSLAVHEESLARERKISQQAVAKAAARIAQEAPKLTVTTEVQEGHPKEVILDEAKRWGADLIIVGSHGRGMAKRMLLGSVSHAVALHAPCSVHIAR